MNIKNNNIKHLTKKQKLMCDKINDLIKRLEKQGVQTCLASTPQNKLIFYRADKWLDSMEDIQNLHNHSEDFVYDVDCSIDAVGY